MPILWKNLLAQYLKVLFFCVTAFITVLVTTRLDEIAHFATLGAEAHYVFLFIFYQIPYVLPIALPISALISSVLLLQGMSRSHELTAMRACGLGMKEIFAPIFLAAFLLSIGSFYVVSELATTSHLSTSLLKHELRSVNPLLILGNKHLMKLKGIHYDTLGPSRQGESASHVVIAMPNKHSSRLNLMVAGNMKVSPTHFVAEQVSLVSALPLEEDESKADLIAVENIGQTTTTVEEFAQMIQKKVWNLNNDHLSMPLLLVRLHDHQTALSDAQKTDTPISEIKQLRRAVNRSIGEINRRLSLSLAVLTFTVMGASFGVSIGRLKSSRSVFFIVFLTGVFLACYFTAGGIDHLLEASTALYFAPHVLILVASLWVLSRSGKGIE